MLDAILNEMVWYHWLILAIMVVVIINMVYNRIFHHSKTQTINLEPEASKPSIKLTVKTPYTCRLLIDPRVYGSDTIIDFMNYLNTLVFKNFSQAYLLIMPNPVFLDRYDTDQLKHMFIAAPNTFIGRNKYSNGIEISYRTGELVQCADNTTMYSIQIDITANKSKIAVRYMKHLLVGYCKYAMDQKQKKESSHPIQP